MDVGGGEGGTRQDGCREGPRTEERDIAKVQQTGKADRNVEAHCGCGEDDHLRGDGHVRVGAALGEGEQERHHKCGEDQYFPVTLRNPGEKAHHADPEEYRDERAEEGYGADEGAPVVDVQCERGSEERCPHHHSDQEDLQRGPDLRLAQRGWLVHDHQPGSGEGHGCTEQRHPAAIHHVDQTTKLKRDAEDDERHVDKRSGSSRLGAAHPADPDLASGLDQP